MSEHPIDVWPIPREETPRFINEPWLIDDTIRFETKEGQVKAREPENQPDNIRVYIPLDLNHRAFLRRLDHVIEHYGEANEGNEYQFSNDVQKILFQIEIYDKIWHVRDYYDNPHSKQAIRIIKDFIHKLEQIPDSCAECFPFDMIDELQKEYLNRV